MTSQENIPSTWWAIRCVWLRYFAVFRKSIAYSIVTTFAEPLLYLVTFGLGVGTLVGMMDVQGVKVHYRSFVFAGVLAQTVLFQGFFGAAYGSFVRMYYQKIFHAMATTPITLSEVLWGELLWDASNATFAAFAVLVIGYVTGQFNIVGCLLALPLSFLCCLMFSGLGLWVAAWSTTIDQIAYPQFLIVFPMFLFCGVFFPLETLPKILQWIAWFLPLTPVTKLARTLLLGFPLDPAAPLLILVWTAILVFGSRRAMMKRLIK